MFLYKIKNTTIKTRLTLSLFFAVLSSIYFLAYTATGLTWILNLNLKNPHGRIAISSVSNNFDGSFALRNLNYTSDSVDILFENVSMKWNPISIFSKQIIVDSLSGTGLTINLKSAKNEKSSSIKLDFPIATNVLQATIRGLKLKRQDKILYAIREASIDNIYLAENFFVDKLVFRSSPNSWLALSGRFGFSSNSIINLTTESKIAIPKTHNSISATGTLVGNVAQIRFLQHVKAPFNTKITGRLRQVFTNPSWVLTSQLDITPEPRAQVVKHVTGNVSLEGNMARSQLVSDLDIKDSESKIWVASLNASSELDNVQFVMDVKNKNSDNTSHVNLKGSYRLSLVTNLQEIIRNLTVRGNWQNLNLHFRDNSSIFSLSGNLEFNGEDLSSELMAKGVQINNLGATINQLSMKTQNLNGGELTFVGDAATSGGELQLYGSMVRTSNNYKLDNLFLSGTNFPLVRKPQAHIVVSPNISFVRSNEMMTSTGTVKIPMANIQLQEFKKTLAQITSLLATGAGPIKSSGHVDVKFGKAVWMHGYGLNAHVTGDLEFRDLSNKELIAFGELNVIRGNYRKLSKNLKLSGGRLKFNNQDIDNPEIDLKVTKLNSIHGDTKNIMGRLQKLFSESNRSDQKNTASGLKRHNHSRDRLALISQH